MVRFLKNTDPRFHLVEARSKWFIGLVLGLLLAVGSLAVWQQEWLRGGRHVVLVAGTSEGLTVGMAVRLSGFRIGKVDAIELDAPGRVRVTARVFHEYVPYVRADSKAMVRGENLIGDRFIEFGVGSEQSPPLAEGETMVLEAEPSIGAMVDAFRAEIRPVLDELQAVVGYLNEPEGDLKTSMRSIRGLTATLDKEAGPALEASRKTADRLQELVADLARKDGSLMTSLDSMERVSRTLDEDIPPMLEKLDLGLGKLDQAGASATEMFDHMDRVVGKMENAVDQAAPEVPGMVKSGAKTMRKADEVVTAVRNMWPVRGGVPEQREQVLRPGSDE